MESGGPRFETLRRGLLALIVGVTTGLILATYALLTAAQPWVLGLGIVLLWSGGAGVTVAAHLEARRSGYRLLSQYVSYPAMILVVGMTIVAIIATIEFSLRSSD